MESQGIITQLMDSPIVPIAVAVIFMAVMWKVTNSQWFIEKVASVDNKKGSALSTGARIVWAVVVGAVIGLVIYGITQQGLF